MLPAEMLPVPVFVVVAVVVTGAAAAINVGSEIATPISCAAKRVGWIRNSSLAAGVPLDSVIAMPSTVCGSVAKVCVVLSEIRVSV